MRREGISENPGGRKGMIEDAMIMIGPATRIDTGKDGGHREVVRMIVDGIIAVITEDNGSIQSQKVYPRRLASDPFLSF